LPYLNQKRLQDEVTSSFNELKKITDKDITTFSYPFGVQNRRVQKVIRQAGYKLACRNISGTDNCNNLFSIPRIPVYKFDTVQTLKRKLALSEYPLEKLKLLILNWPGRFTPLYQILFRKHLSLEK
jgi:peptidoglycan/xylan/chitin deacetylase (PgdA/CDA1 family)